jgi:hypothetical protein
MRTLLTLAAAVVINVTAFAALEWNVTQTQLPPPGEVTITQVDEPQFVAFAEAAPAVPVDHVALGRIARTGSSSL